MKTLRSVAALIANIIIFIYALGVIPLIPYYNYRYAKDNGFLNWLLLGEVIATAKAFTWPYFAITGAWETGGEKNSEFEDNMLLFNKTNASLASAFEIIYNRENFQQLTNEEFWELVGNLQKTKEFAEKIDPKFLAATHKELPEKISQLTKAIETIKDGAQSGDRKKVAPAFRSIEHYCYWLNKNEKSFSEEDAEKAFLQK